MHNLAQSYEGFANALATKWGMYSRDKTGTAPPPHIIPPKQTVASGARVNNQGPRFMLQSKRLTDAIIKGSIVSVINDHYKNRALPKCAPHPLYRT